MDQSLNMQGKWLARDENVWAKRPLSDQMVDYACYDVLTLMPELYNKLKGWVSYGSLAGLIDPPAFG